MPGLLIRDLPPDLHERLKERARANRRSLAAEVLVILEERLDARTGPRTVDEIDRLRIRGQRLLGQEILDLALGTGRP